MNKYISRNVGKRTFFQVRQMKTQISLYIHVFWSQSSLSIKKSLASLAVLNAHSDESDQKALDGLNLHHENMPT